MTRIIQVDPRQELIIHSIAIESKSDGQRLDYFWHKEERARGYEIKRILVSCKTVRVMDRDDPITIPIQHAGQCLDGQPVICRKARERP